MAKAYLVVRAEVPEAERGRFEHWYATDHLPWAIRAFGAVRGWRAWSRTEPGSHFAFYEFPDAATAETVLGSDAAKPLVVDFDRVWGNRVPRRREIIEVAQEM